MGEVLAASPPTNDARLPQVSADTVRIVGTIPDRQVGELFEAAAGKVERYASQFTRWALPWYAAPDDPAELRDPDEGGDGWMVRAQPTPVAADAPEPHAFRLAEHGSLALLGGGFILDDVSPAVARWVSMMGPQVAGALAAALRAAARDARDDPANSGALLYRHLMALAVEIMHEEDPRDDDL